MDEKYKLSEGHSLPNVLSKWWPIVKKDLQTIIGFVNQHITGEGDRHTAADVDYDDGTVKEELDAVKVVLGSLGDTITDLGTVYAKNYEANTYDEFFTDITTTGLYKFRVVFQLEDAIQETYLFVGYDETYQQARLWQMVCAVSVGKPYWMYRVKHGDEGWTIFESLFAPLSDDGKIYTSYLPTIPINKGGTNATTAADARTNLGAASQEDLDALKKPVAATSTDGVAYTATVEGVTELFAGLTLKIIPDTRSTNVNVTLDVNGLGAKTIRWASNSYTNILITPMNSNWMGANRPVTLMYNGTYWVTTSIQGVNANYINTGTLPIARGGTGATTVEEALKNLGLDSLSGGITDLGRFEGTREEFERHLGQYTTQGVYTYELQETGDWGWCTKGFMFVTETGGESPGNDHEQDWCTQILYDDYCYTFMRRQMHISDTEYGAFEEMYPQLGSGIIPQSYLPRIPITGGGTGAKTAADARTNLGAASQTDFDALVARVEALEAAAASENS